MDETKKTFNPIYIIGAVIVLLVIGGVVLMASNGKTNSTAMPNSQTTISTQPMNMNNDTDSDDEDTIPATNQPAESNPNTQTITIEAGSFYYKPNEIRAKVNQPLKIVMTSKDMMHNFNINELNVHIPITRSGQTNTAEFTPTQKGTFEFYCSVANHRAQGQVGKLIVE